MSNIYRIKYHHHEITPHPFLDCLLFAVTIFAQQYLSFKGVPINGTLQEYTYAMVKAGFHYEGSQDGISLLTGDFAKFKNCHVGGSALGNLDLVNRIAVLFPEKDTWSAVMSNYKHSKEMLTKVVSLHNVLRTSVKR